MAILIVPLAVALVMTLFAWPSARPEPRDLPVGVAGPPNAVQPIEQRIAAADGSFDVHRYADEAAAREAIEDRDIYGAVVVSAWGPDCVMTRLGRQPHRGADSRARRTRPSRPCRGVRR